jgi:hypothetical protein
VGERAVLAAVDEPAAAFDGERGVTVRHGRVFLLVDELVVLLILPGKTRPPDQALCAVINVTSRNN